MKKLWLKRRRNRKLTKVKRILKIFATQESLANNMLMYLFSDSNYPLMQEYESDLFSVCVNKKEGEKLAENPAILN